MELPRRLLAEGLGTGLLVATVVGSGIMAESLAGGNGAIALLCNTIPTAAVLIVLVAILAPISGAHLNPAVSAVFAWRRELALPAFVGYVVAHCLGGVLGTALAHFMFNMPAWSVGDHARNSAGIWLGEIVATFSLVLVILLGRKNAPAALPYLIGLVIAAAYWFTSSTSFANPAVTLARGLTTTFAGVAITDVPAFVVAQLLGAAIAAGVAAILLTPSRSQPAAG
jgi:glycerol uptake facilitator-like aquaporin